MENAAVIIDYTNWRGERSERRVRPLRLHFEANKYHPGIQWLLEAIDLEKNAVRMFAMASVHSWRADASDSSTMPGKQS